MMLKSKGNIPVYNQIQKFHDIRYIYVYVVKKLSKYFKPITCLTKRQLPYYMDTLCEWVHF